MMTQIRTIIDRNEATLVQDAIGAVAIAVILLVALHLPAMA